MAAALGHVKALGGAKWHGGRESVEIRSWRLQSSHSSLCGVPSILQQGAPPKVSKSLRCTHRWRTEVSQKCQSSTSSSVERVEAKDEPVDIVILTNGPGEVATWVKPVVATLRQSSKEQGIDMRISVILAPCPHASGGELQLLQSFVDIDRSQGPEGFYSLLLCGQSQDHWEWRKRGVCIFLGGDQFNAVLLGWRLGYRTVVYAEDAVRWPGLVDAYLLRSQETLLSVPQWAHQHCYVVGDLFSDAVESSSLRNSWTLSCTAPAQGQAEEIIPVVGLLPGSKMSNPSERNKTIDPEEISFSEYKVGYWRALFHGSCRSSTSVDSLKGKVRFVLPLAPTVTVSELENHASATSNALISRFHWADGKFIGNREVKMAMESRGARSEHFKGEALGQLLTQGQVPIEIWQQFPPHSLYQGCTLCLTTVGTNTAELGILGVPMLVVLPTNILETFRGATGGLLGLLAAIPGRAGASMAHYINLGILRTAGYISWPNRWAGESIVPELIGEIEPVEVAAVAAEYLESPDLLQAMHQRLLDLRSPLADDHKGAAHSVALTVKRLLQA